MGEMAIKLVLMSWVVSIISYWFGFVAGICSERKRHRRND
jgi:hypothetical protein